MKNKGIFFLLLMLTITLFACRTIPISLETNQPPAEPDKSYFADPEKMDFGTNLALAAIDTAKLGFLESFPLVITNPQTKINIKNQTDYFNFKQHNILITEDTKSPEGISTLDMICESVDSFGRTDYSKNKIIYELRSPDKKEIDDIKESITQAIKSSKQIKDNQSSDYMKKKVIEYQRAKGLTPDGIAGKKTIASLFKGLSVIDLEELTTEVVYPENPRISVFIVPSETFNSNQDEFNKGFKSIDKVRKNAVSINEFRNLAKPGEEFVVFIYFLDRVDPSYALKWCLANNSKKLSKAVSSIFYAEPETWPVIVQTFNIDRKDSFKQFYINLFRTSKLSTTRIASYEIK